MSAAWGRGARGGVGQHGHAMQIRDQFRAVATPESDALDAPSAQAPPAWRTSLIGGATAASISLVATLICTGIVGSLAARASQGWGEIFAIGSALWLTAGGARLAADGVFIAITPLLGTALIGWVAVRAARRCLPEAGPRRLAYAGWFGGYAAIVVAAIALALSGPATPVWWSLPLPVLAVPAVALAVVEIPRGRWEAAVRRMPRLLRRALRPALRTAALLMATGMSLVLLAACVRLGEVGRLYAELQPGMLGALALTVAQVLVWPNLGLWSIGLLSGPGFTVTEGAAVTLGGSDGGVLPLIPVLGAVPSQHDFPWFAWLLLLVPVVIGGYAARRTLAEIPRLASTRTKLLSVLATVALTSVLLALADAIAGGSLGDGRLASIGPSALSLTVSVSLTLGAGALAVVVADWWRLRR